jgi:integrase
MASLQARHSRSCPVCPGRQESTGAADTRGCGCRMSFYVVTHADRKPVREAVGQDRAKAEKRLRAIEVHVDEGRYEPPRVVRFETFADEWLRVLRRRSTTADNYGVTLEFAKRAFRRRYVSKLSVADVRKMLELVETEYRDRQKLKKGEEPREVSPTTLGKHLRQLSTCLDSAVAEGLLAVNPCKRLPKSQKPKARKRRPAYFTDAELKRLWPELESRPVYLFAAKLAATTGMRQGEIAGLHWDDVDLLGGEIHVRRQFTDGELVDRPKDADDRVVDLVPAARELLEAWFTKTGDDGFVVENEVGAFLDASQMRKVLYAAMKRAGIPRVGERGGTRDWHSLRHTFARIALENGAQLEWVQAQLGHSSITLTRDTYGHWSRQAEKREAERLGGAFAV